MKRVALLCVGLAVGAASAAEAQLTMQMSNGWSFTFSGNVNAFGVYESVDDEGGTLGAPGGLIGIGGKGFSIRTGLLPAFAVFDAKGKEGNTDLGVHFGFAPQIQGGGTTLGRIGFGYIYPNFVAQMTYSTPAGRPGQLSIGLFQPSALNSDIATAYGETEVPRIEAEGTFKTGDILLWLNGTAQNAKNDVIDESKTAVGAGGGFRFGRSQFSLTGSGYWGKGIGTTLQFNGVGACDPTVGCSAVNGLGVGADGELRDSYGFIGQVTFTPANSKLTVAGSYGSSFLEASDGEPPFKTENTLISGGIYFQATKSLKVVGEGNYAWTKETEADTPKNSTF